MTQEFVTLPREVVEQAISTIVELEYSNSTAVSDKMARDSKAALRAALKQPQANQPAMTPIAQRKLEDLMESGYTISGYSVYHEQKHQHGFVTGAGLVGWWQPDGMEYPQPQVEQEPVGEAGSMPGTDGFTMACFRASDVPVGTKLYARPHPRQPLNDDEILHTGIPEQLWFAKRFGSAPAGWTDEQIRTHNFFQSAVTQLVRAIERAHGIK